MRVRPHHGPSTYGFAVFPRKLLEQLENGGMERNLKKQQLRVLWNTLQTLLTNPWKRASVGWGSHFDRGVVMQGLRFVGGVVVIAMSLVSIDGVAQAQSSMVNGKPFAEIEGGAALWFGQQTFKTSLDDGAGSQSHLDWKTTAATLELTAKLAAIDTGMWFRGMGGGGLSLDGSMTDVDQGQLSSSTSAKLDSKPNYYFGADIGWTPSYFQTKSFSLSPFAGIFYTRSSFRTKEGATCNQVDTYSSLLQSYGNVNGQVCAAAGAKVNTSIGAVQTDVIGNDVTFWAPRIGVAAQYEFANRWSVSGEVAYLFLGQYKNEDSHFSRGGAQPYFVDTSSAGSGLQMQATVDYHIPDSQWTVGGGVRYWKIDSGTAQSIADASGSAVPGGVTKNTLETFGGMLRASYGF